MFIHTLCRQRRIIAPSREIAFWATISLFEFQIVFADYYRNHFPYNQLQPPLKFYPDSVMCRRVPQEPKDARNARIPGLFRHLLNLSSGQTPRRLPLAEPASVRDLQQRNGTITTVPGDSPRWKSLRFNYLGLSNRCLTLRSASIAFILTIESHRVFAIPP